MRKGALLALLVALVAAPPARADHEETELRLKTAGVDDALRTRIHTAIDRGVAFLLSRQGESGSWPMRARGTYDEAGHAALCTLALRHAGTKTARAGFDKGMAFLFPTGERDRGHEQMHRYIYTAGITNMILMADRTHPEVARQIADGIARSYEPKSGWWGYFILTRYAADPGPGKPPPRTIEPAEAWMMRNLSTSQFAALGMWAGDRLGARVEKRFWRLHLEGLIRYQTASGSWPYDPLRGTERAYGPDGEREVDRRFENPDALPPEILHKGRPTGTFMGLANLLLAERALGDVLRRDAALAAETKRARWRAMDALHRDGPVALAHLREHGWMGADTYYTLYALEKACVFADLERVGGVPWYVSGAQWLCDTQRADGGWGDVAADPRQGGFGTNADIDTAFALLFLLRASAAYTPRDPRPVDSAEITPGSNDADTAGRARLLDASPPAGRVDVELSMARVLLERLRARIDDEAASNDHLAAALDDVDMAYHGLVPDETPQRDADAETAHTAAAAAWKTDAHELAIRLLTLFDIEFGTRENRRLPVNVAAARTLGGWDAAVSELVIAAFTDAIFREKAFRVDPELFRVGFASLASLGDPEALRWLAVDVARAATNPDQVARTLHAFDAIPTFDRVPGDLRFEAVKHLTNEFKDVARSKRHYHQRLMDELGPALVMALRHLARDPRDGRAPRLEDRGIATFADFQAWLEANDDPRASPWR